jgi:DNA (cytosine-5)-methyltransferase 1
MKLLDTFAGIGGFSYAAEKLVGGFETTQFIEINPFCQKILNKHWSHVPIHDDITTFTAKSGEFDIITGGFPCQDISVAGLQKGITEETRSGLFFELMRVIRMVRPRYVVLENVAAILNRGLDIVLRELSEAGYDAEWSVIPASSVGACHQRSRWWLVAYPNDNGLPSSEKCGFNAEASDRTQEGQNQSCQSERSSKPSSSEAIQSSTEFTNSYSKGMERRKFTINTKMQKTGFTWQSNTPHLSPNWRSYVSKSVLCRGDDGLRGRMDRLKALGNSVVPQCAAIPLQRVKDLYATAS